jgi:ubiquinone biosynthesis protein
MTKLKSHVNFKSSAGSLFTSWFSRHPERYIEILRVLRRYEIHHVAAQFRRAHRHGEEDEAFALNGLMERDDHAEGLASALEELGPCFIKLGQLLSTRPDLLPANYIAALSRLQDRIVPVPSDKIIRVIESELGRPIAALFQSFDREPLATASIAQVHRAILHDGDEVVVKVQRPGVRQRIEIDVEVLHEIAHFTTRYTSFGARYGLSQIVRELEHSLSQELDFRLEADNTRLIGRQIADFRLLTTPAVYSDYTSRRVLTLSFIHGRHLTRLSREELNTLDLRAIAKDLLSAYLKQIVIDGVFHGDPHPGNILLTDDGRLALMDFFTPY